MASLEAEKARIVERYDRRIAILQQAMQASQNEESAPAPPAKAAPRKRRAKHVDGGATRGRS